MNTGFKSGGARFQDFSGTTNVEVGTKTRSAAGENFDLKDF